MRKPTAGLVLALCVSALYVSAGHAQNTTACAFVSKAEAESILGTNVELRLENKYQCMFIQPGFTSKPPLNKQVVLNIGFSPTPNPNDYSERRKTFATVNGSPGVVKDVPGLADAAIWSWVAGWGGTLVAFKGGTSQIEVRISGIPEDAALQHAKTLAAKALGGSGKSGYAYVGAPGSPLKVSPTPTVQSPAAYSAAWMGQSRVVRGTVSRINLDMKGYPRWLTIYFKESPDAAFVVCSPAPEIFQDAVGQLYALVGKTVEVTGQVEDAYCASKAASIRVVSASDFHIQTTVADAAPSRPAFKPASPRLEGARVGIDICNGGTADFDVFVVLKRGGPAGTHVAARDCAHVYEEKGGPAYLGFAFSNSQGQWVGASRIDLLPNDTSGPTEAWSKVSQSTPVKHAGHEISLPLPLFFSPPRPICRTTQSYSATSRLPMNATAAQRNAAAMQDANAPPSSTNCDNLDYTLNVIAHPDTREVAFENKCFACPHAVTSPEDRAGAQRVVGTMSGISPMAGGIMGGLIARQQDEALKESAEGPPEFQRMNWNEMNAALAKVNPSGGRPDAMPKYLIIRGTVSRVDESLPGASVHWVNVYFRESAEQESNRYETFYGAFNTCTSDATIFEDMFGPDYRTRMIGQVLEIQGQYSRAYCKGFKGGIRLTLASQVHKVGGINAVDTKKPPTR